jgi:hypothetical protein
MNDQALQQVHDHLNATTNGQISKDFCAVWPEAKVVLEAIGPLVGFIPNEGHSAAAVIKALLSVGDEVAAKVCV